MLAGAVSMIVSGVAGVGMVYAFHLDASLNLGAAHLISSLSLVLIAYSLTTSHLYHFSELLRKTLAFLVMTVILLGVFGGTHFLSFKLLVPYIPRSDYFALGMASIIMALLFHPLRFRVQNLVDRVFFAQRYDQMQRLRGLSRRVLSSADRDELFNILFSSLRAIGFGSVSLMLKDPQKPIFHIRKSVGLSGNAEGFFLKSDSLLIQHVREEKGELIRDEVTRRILTDWERQSISEEMDILQSEICFPLFSTRRRALFGVITLGNSDLGYSSYKGRNIFWLKSVIDNAGVMLDNFYHQEFANALVPYVGKTWATEMRRNKEGFRERLSGHRVWVSVLMVDIRHFTPLSARLDPREVVELLKDFRSRVAPVVYRYQGTIDKFIGDAIMIVFGLPILPHLANPDKAAVDCAIDIMREMEAMNAKRFETGRREPIAIGIGVSSGEVIAGNVDSGDRVEYTVIGDAANMVARLEDLAGDNQILLSTATYGRVKETVSVKAWKPRYVQGFDEPVMIYELLGSTDDDAEAPAAPESGTIAANQ
jgi:class 3 adenylate cyclase